MSGCEKKRVISFALAHALTLFLWAQLGSNQRPPDYESGAANHLSYGPKIISDCNISDINIILQELVLKKIDYTNFVPFFASSPYLSTYPSVRVFMNATIAASSSAVSPRFPSSSVLMFCGISGSGHLSTGAISLVL